MFTPSSHKKAISMCEEKSSLAKCRSSGVDLEKSFRCGLE